MKHLSVIIGRRGAGKSTLAATWAQWAAREGAYVVVHDPMGSFSLRDERGILGHQAGLVSVVRGAVDFDRLLADCRALGLKSERGCLLVLDEGVLLTSGEKPGKVRQKVRELAATARHVRLGLVVVCQAANLLDYQLLALADQIACFASTDDFNAQKLRAAGVPVEVTTKLKLLPDRQYWCGAPGRPPVEWKLYSTRLAARAA